MPRGLSRSKLLGLKLNLPMPVTPKIRSRAARLIAGISALSLLVTAVFAHPLGNFTINHFARIASSTERVQVLYVVDLAEIPTFQESKAADSNGDDALSEAELQALLDRLAPGYLAGLQLTADGRPIDLQLVAKTISLQPGAAQLPTMRLVLDLVGKTGATGGTARLRVENTNGRERSGWFELMVGPLGGARVYDSSIFGSSVSDELKAYPQDQLMAPLNERVGEWSITRGAIPDGARPLMLRDGHPATTTRDRFAELIAVPQLTIGVALLGLLFAFALGGLHALSPGHGKTVVGAYLVGARGTARHAVFLGIVVTITHTAGVFALGIVTLFASTYILPERLYPMLGLVSGAIVVAIGLSLFTRRLRVAMSAKTHDHIHHHHDHADAEGHIHSHLPPGTNGSPVTWRSLLALGVSGGLLPCPSALVVLLAAISLGRVGYGLLLIIAFSVGLAGVLTSIGLLFVYAGRWLKLSGGVGTLARVLPVASALVITVIGAVICYQSLGQAGVSAASLWNSGPSPVRATAGTISMISILGAGLVLGLKHAIEADHLAAISTIVSERKSLLSSSLIGGLWGIGHTISLLAAGVVVILLQVKIPPRVAQALEFCVALMLIALGVNALYKLARGGRLHLHVHTHGGFRHVHPHMHSNGPDQDPRSHHGLGLSLRPVFIGMVHGLAGSAALMLLVLTTITSPAIAFAYIAIFGLGSIGGMMVMSSLIGLPAHLAANRFERAHLAIRTLAGFFSLGFGLFLAWEIGFVGGLLR